MTKVLTKYGITEMTNELIMFEKTLVVTELIDEMQLERIRMFINSDDVDENIKVHLRKICDKEIYRKTYAMKLRNILKKYDKTHLLNTHSDRAKAFKEDMIEELNKHSIIDIFRLLNNIE